MLSIVMSGLERLGTIRTLPARHDAHTCRNGPQSAQLGDGAHPGHMPFDIPVRRPERLPNAIEIGVTIGRPRSLVGSIGRLRAGDPSPDHHRDEHDGDSDDVSPPLDTHVQTIP